MTIQKQRTSIQITSHRSNNQIKKNKRNHVLLHLFVVKMTIDNISHTLYTLYIYVRFFCQCALLIIFNYFYLRYFCFFFLLSIYYCFFLRSNQITHLVDKKSNRHCSEKETCKKTIAIFVRMDLYSK